MSSTEFFFLACLFLVFYTHIGYGLLLFLLTKLKGTNPKVFDDSYLPTVTFIVAAYNEEDWINDKILNCMAFDYPSDKIEFWFVTDGSNDSTPSIIENFVPPPGKVVKLFHRPERMGKIAAIDRIMPQVTSEICIFTDANTDVNPDAIKKMVRHYIDPKVGAIAGEKRISIGTKGDATGAGESIYWKYESTLKRLDSELYSAIGAAGELFSIRTALFEPVPKDTYIEDFVMTMKIAMKGYKIVYEPEAYASEGQSASMGEEMKRKVRIAAGGLQAFWRLRHLLLPFKNPMLTFQYISHRALRWTLAPLALPTLFILNWLLALEGNIVYQALFACQCLFYSLALIGLLMEKQKLKIKMFFVPYYFCFMNFAMYRGFWRLMAGNQSVKWEKAKRSLP